MLTVVTYLWGTKHYKPAHVHLLARSVARWLSLPHRFVCISDDRIEGLKTIRSQAPPWGRCFRRLWLFSKEAAGFGDGILHLDLDTVICGPLDALVTSGDDFKIYRAGSIAAKGYSLNPSVMWLRPGTQTDIWERFVANPGGLAKAANKAGFWGSDQAVISYLRQGVEVPTYSYDDGVISFRHVRHERLKVLPAHAKVVSFHGKKVPWDPEVLAEYPWIQRAWDEAA